MRLAGSLYASEGDTRASNPGDKVKLLSCNAPLSSRFPKTSGHTISGPEIALPLLLVVVRKRRWCSFWVID